MIAICLDLVHLGKSIDAIIYAAWLSSKTVEVFEVCDQKFKLEVVLISKQGNQVSENLINANMAIEY